MNESSQVRCDCGTIEPAMTGPPPVHAFCHCEGRRALLDVPYHSIATWDADNDPVVP